MECIYFLKDGNGSYTYKELVELFLSQKINDVSDIVYSKSTAEVRQDDIHDRLAALRREGIYRSREDGKAVSYEDGEPVIRDDSSLSTLEFIDSPSFTDGKRQLITKMSDLKFIESTIASLTTASETNPNPVSQEEAEFIANQTVENWKTIGEDAKELHNLIADFDFRKGRSEFVEALKGTKFEDTAGRLYDSISTLRRNIFGKVKHNGVSARAIYNLNLKAELQGLDKDLFGHIDLILIDSYGDLHIFNYKMTTTPVDLRSTKFEKYRYQMALLKQMLANHGINVRRATLNIVPIRVNYNDDFSKIESAISQEKPIELTVSEDGKYIFRKYDDVARKFIKSTVETSNITTEDITAAEEQLKLIFLERDVSSRGVRMTAEEWIRKNRDKIIDSNDPEYAYEIEFGEGDTVRIQSRVSPMYNDEIKEAVLARTSTLLNSDDDIVMDRLLKDIRHSFQLGFPTFRGERAYKRSSQYLETVLNKYFSEWIPGEKDGDKIYDWELVENDILNSANILLFKNRITGQLDVVALSPYDLTVEAKFKKGEHILGSHLDNARARSFINYKATYGNIEAVRVMTLLNLVLPKISGYDALGKLLIISLQGNGHGIPFSIETLNKECFAPIIKYLNKLPETKVSNNFTNLKFVDRFQLIVSEYENIVKTNKLSEAEKQNMMDIGFTRLQDANTIESKRTALAEVEQALREAYGINTNNFDTYYSDLKTKRVAMLYEAVMDAIAYYNVGEASPIEQKMSSIERNVNITKNIPNRNFRLISELYTRTINRISEEAEARWVPIRKALYEYYDAVGYSAAQNSIIGNQASQFDDLYRKDLQGNRLLRLLNPYDSNDMAQVDLRHRAAKEKFLKRILFEFAKIRYPMNDIAFNYTSEHDPRLQEFIKDHSDTYFNIPLERASNATRRANTSIVEKAKYGWEMMTAVLRDPQKAFERYVNGSDSAEASQLREDGFEMLQLFNKFQIGEGNKRANYIATHGVNFFETNLENLMIDFLEKDIQVREYNKALVIIKAVLFKLDKIGNLSGLTQVIEQTEQLIKDFTSLNIFDRSIMEKSSQNIIARVAPFKKFVSDTLIAGNIVSMFRDTFEGVWQNIARTINHYQTEIDGKSLTKAYGTVIANSFTNGRTINIVNQLCLIYRLSNIDVSRISEGLKSERGLLNFENWMYATLRRPDFLNRMVLFVAKCHQDGVYDAFDIKDGKLVYDWKKDARFMVYASGDKSNPKYKEQMGAYYNAIRAYNQEHPEATIGYNDDLPMPYSLQEVETMKNLANNIYGSYDKSTRAMYEHMALGTFFGMFSTWMNGMYANYMMKPGQYGTAYELEQATDESGNLLFFDDLGLEIVQVTDEEGNVRYYYRDGREATTNLSYIQPVMDKVPLVVQGIWYTLKDTANALFTPDGNFKEDIWSNPMQRKNLEKLFSDLLAWLLFGSLFGLVLGPGYKEFKKGMKDRDVLTNATIELLYKSSSRSYDGFRGIYNVWEYLGENTNPPIYTQNVKVLTDLAKATFGSRTYTDVLNGNVAVFKTFQDTWRAYDKSLAETNK